LHSPLANIKIAATTWVDVSEEGKEKSRKTEVIAQKARFMKTLQAWGNPIVIDKVGSPMQALQSVGLCLSHQSIANKGVLPMSDALKILPSGRPAQIFKEGSQIFQSIDGKILPFQRFSSLQTTWITLITGRPGFGKSVLLNDLHLELCCTDGLNELPYICSIDIGMSSKGIIELLQQSLPPEKRTFLMYARLQNSIDFAINPFDTPVGCRYPLAKDRSFLVNFVTILSTPAERKGSAFQGMNDLIARLIDLVYQYKADDRDRSYPNLYIPGHNLELDQKVEAYFQKYPERYTQSLNYWRITDLFFDEGDLLGAELAQRYAVPILDDLISIAASYDVQQEFQEMVTEQGVSLLDTLQNNLRSAIGQFPILSNYTRFDIGSSRIMSLDLNDVTAQGGSDQNLKTNALMYMMARQCFMKKVAYSKEDLFFIPPKYQRYYDQLIKKLIDSKKSLCYDEYHRTGNITALEQQTLLDARESRKWQMELIIASQFLQDMGQLTDIATNIFLCDAGTQSSRLFIKKNLGLTEAQESKLIEYAQGPSAKGMCFLGIQDTRDFGKIYQIYQFKVGPQRLWALSSTAEDRRLRQYLIDSGLSIRQALELLAQKYPSGSCKKALEAYQRQLGQQGQELISDEDAEKNEQQGVEFLGQALLNEYNARAK
jgi:intracellular multiplication protein IcmB